MQPTLRRLLRHTPRRWSALISAVAGACVLAFAAPLILSLGASGETSPGQSVALDGVFELTPGTCNPTGTQVGGSYFRLIFPGGGNPNSGRYFLSADSACADKSYTLLRPGVQGGLRTDAYQPDPSPAFGPAGNPLANSIVAPVSFAGAGLSLATNPTDPQTHRAAPAPRIFLANGSLAGQVEAVSAAWDKTYFNQGSPKPGQTQPRLPSGVIGSYSESTHAFAMTWTSQIAGGLFDGFTGDWYLKGTFQGRANPANVSTAPKTKAAIATTTSKKSSSKTDLFADVRLTNCEATAGGWRAGGIVRNPSSSQPDTLYITVRFIAPNGQRLASSTAAAPLPPEGSVLWTTVANLRARPRVRCVLGGVSAA
jgi:hypothetical protein